MRITGGLAKGIILETDWSEGLRPATDYNRQSLFGGLEGIFTIEGCSFLDLFAGTGAYGLECFSRGAHSGVFVEQDKQRVEQIKKNIHKVAKSAQKSTDGLKVICADVFKFVTTHDAKYDILFIDPPYELYEDKGKIFQLCKSAVNNLLEVNNGLCIFEVPLEQSIPVVEGLKLKKVLGKEGKNRPKLMIYEYTK